MLKGKKIVVGITGSIAAYKSAYLIRLLIQSGAEVKVVMSKGAHQFLTPLTFSTLSKNPVYTDFTENADSGLWTNHVELALWGDLFIMAPLSANTLSKMANGQSDSFLLAVYMSCKCQVMVAPAMDHDMYLHGGTQDNLKKLASFGHIILQPNEGELASGLVGKGRMAEPEEILSSIVDFFHPSLPLKGKKALVTAGPTYEKMDPVRFIGNFSSGKMGFAIADRLAEMGAQVQLISGPSHEKLNHPMVQIHRVVSAQEMAEKAFDLFDQSEITVLSAAVADFKPATMAGEKIKKKDAVLFIELTPTIDIALELGKRKKKGQIIVGFALETENVEANAQKKLESKNFDMIVLNSLRDDGAGFGEDTNKITVFWPGNKTTSFGLKSKSEVAKDIADLITRLTQA